MSKLGDLIPPDVDVSASTTAQILNRALEDAQGWFDPLKEPGRAVDRYEAMLHELVRIDDVLITVLKAALGKFLPHPGDHIRIDVTNIKGAEALAGEHSEIVIMNREGALDIVSGTEYNELHGG